MCLIRYAVLGNVPDVEYPGDYLSSQKLLLVVPFFQLLDRQDFQVVLVVID